MLDKELCELLEVDEYQQYLMSELDYYEDELNNEKSIYSEETKERMRAQYIVLKKALVVYCNFKKQTRGLPDYSDLSLEEIIFLNKLKKILKMEKGVDRYEKDNH